MSLVVAVKMLVEATAEALRPFDLSREDAADLLGKYPPMRKLRELDDATADEVRDLVLSRFAAAEPPSVPGLDWLPEVKADAKQIFADKHDRFGTRRGVVMVQPDAAKAVWDGSVPPGGWVCGVCRTPVESEPCPKHGAGA